MLGATAGQIRGMYLGESVVIGVLGSCAGIGLGLLIARGMASFIGAYLGEVYGVAQSTEEITANPTLLLIALAMGVATSLIAAVIPANLRAGRSVVAASVAAQIVADAENLVRQMIAMVFLVATGVCIFLRAVHYAIYIGFGLTIVTALLLAPTFSLFLSKLSRPFLAAMFPVEGVLAADSLTRRRRGERRGLFRR